jgi:hypothetical protein
MNEAKRKRRIPPSGSRSGKKDTRWIRSGKSVSTFAPRGTFRKDAEQIARVMVSPRVSPKGIGSAIRMVQFLLNRGGKGLSAARRRELERAKRLLQEKHAVRRDRAQDH